MSDIDILTKGLLQSRYSMRKHINKIYILIFLISSSLYATDIIDKISIAYVLGVVNYNSLELESNDSNISSYRYRDYRIGIPMGAEIIYKYYKLKYLTSGKRIHDAEFIFSNDLIFFETQNSYKSGKLIQPDWSKNISNGYEPEYQDIYLNNSTYVWDHSNLGVSIGNMPYRSIFHQNEIGNPSSIGYSLLASAMYDVSHFDGKTKLIGEEAGNLSSIQGDNIHTIGLEVMPILAASVSRPSISSIYGAIGYSFVFMPYSFGSLDTEKKIRIQQFNFYDPDQFKFLLKIGITLQKFYGSIMVRNNRYKNFDYDNITFRSGDSNFELVCGTRF